MLCGSEAGGRADVTAGSAPCAEACDTGGFAIVFFAESTRRQSIRGREEYLRREVDGLCRAPK